MSVNFKFVIQDDDRRMDGVTRFLFKRFNRILGIEYGVWLGKYYRNPKRSVVEVYLANHMYYTRTVRHIVDTIRHEYMHHVLADATRNKLSVEEEHWAIGKIK